MANRLTSVLQQVGGKVFLKGAITIAILIALGFAAKTVDFDKIFEALPFSRGDDAGWTNGKSAFLVFSGVLVAIGCPRQAVSFFAAYFFGLWTGIMLALGGTILGCVLTYSTARLFSQFFKGVLGGKLKIAVEFWRENTFFATMIWRFLPAGSNFLTNIAAGVLGLPAMLFFAGSGVGYVPQTIVFALMGSGVEVGSTTRISVSIGLFVLSAMLGLMLYARYRKQLASGG